MDEDRIDFTDGQTSWAENRLGCGITVAAMLLLWLAALAFITGMSDGVVIP